MLKQLHDCLVRTLYHICKQAGLPPVMEKSPIWSQILSSPQPTANHSLWIPVWCTPLHLRASRQTSQLSFRTEPTLKPGNECRKHVYDLNRVFGGHERIFTATPSTFNLDTALNDIFCNIALHALGAHNKEDRKISPSHWCYWQQLYTPDHPHCCVDLRHKAVTTRHDSSHELRQYLESTNGFCCGYLCLVST
jgi:hypothetical protein